MRVYRDRLEVTRGESFNYGIEITNNDGSPFIISNQLSNPYFLVTVASTKYAQYGRYLHNYWNKINDTYLRFYCTTPIVLADDTKAPAEALSGQALADYIKYIKPDSSGNPTVSPSTYSVYKINDTYKYWTGTAYEDYKLLFTQTFVPIDTLEWVEQEYEFAMKLIDGNEVYDATDMKPLRNYSFMQKINVPEKIVVTSNLSGTMNALEDIL